jgi:hypothetical protein
MVSQICNVVSKLCICTIITLYVLIFCHGRWCYCVGEIREIGGWIYVTFLISMNYEFV